MPIIATYHNLSKSSSAAVYDFSITCATSPFLGYSELFVEFRDGSIFLIERSSSLQRSLVFFFGEAPVASLDL